ncbi:hypothetical protein Taro_016549 [Colocasia esculenta]|uniref:Non-haem dioxygenase N-terminal domain-containing protein n=1 Tax=Colocasia esculenta TaxID=4460 RepID=A0A843UTA5_COLES|nr:hypothetical protein [Colocasia esculenta]
MARKLYPFLTGLRWAGPSDQALALGVKVSEIISPPTWSHEKPPSSLRGRKRRRWWMAPITMAMTMAAAPRPDRQAGAWASVRAEDDGAASADCFFKSLDRVSSSISFIGGCPCSSSDSDVSCGVAFESSPSENQAYKILARFVWPRWERPEGSLEELAVPVIDLAGFFQGDKRDTLRAAEVVGEASRTHGFFQVTHHGVDGRLLRDALGCLEVFFQLLHPQKLKAQRKPGSTWGYAGAHADRFTSNLPWKETLSVEYQHSDAAGADPHVVQYFTSVLGEEFRQMG